MAAARGSRRVGTPSQVNPSAIAYKPAPPRYSAKMRCTIGAAVASTSSLWRRWPSAAFDGFGCGPAIATTWGVVLGHPVDDHLDREGQQVDVRQVVNRHAGDCTRSLSREWVRTRRWLGA